MIESTHSVRENGTSTGGVNVGWSNYVEEQLRAELKRLQNRNFELEAEIKDLKCRSITTATRQGTTYDSWERNALD